MESGDFYEPSIASMGMKMRGVQLGILVASSLTGSRPKKYPLEKICTKPASCQMLWEDGRQTRLKAFSLCDTPFCRSLCPQSYGGLDHRHVFDSGAKQESEKACGEFKIE